MSILHHPPWEVPSLHTYHPCITPMHLCIGIRKRGATLKIKTPMKQPPNRCPEHMSSPKNFPPIANNQTAPISLICLLRKKTALLRAVSRSAMKPKHYNQGREKRGDASQHQGAIPRKNCPLKHAAAGAAGQGPPSALCPCPVLGPAR